MAPDLFTDWVLPERRSRGNYIREILAEVRAERKNIMGVLCKVMQTHYVDPKRVSARIRRLGYNEAAKRLNMYLPTDPKAKSGDLGEILATEYVGCRLGFEVPIFRLRWKDGRNMALRGDDLIATSERAGRLQILKGEVKSRKTLSPVVVRNAMKQLRRNGNRPSSHTVNFIIDRLEDLGRADLAKLLDNYLDNGVSLGDIHHLLFTLSGNDPAPFFDAALAGRRRAVVTTAVGLVIEDHSKFINGAYRRIKWQT